MEVARRIVWIVVFIAGIPAILLGVFHLYSFLLVPLVFFLGVGWANSQRARAIGLGCLVGLALLFVVLLALNLGPKDERWWWYAGMGASAVAALASTFKAGIVAHDHLPWGRARDQRKHAADMSAEAR